MGVNPFGHFETIDLLTVVLMECP